MGCDAALTRRARRRKDRGGQRGFLMVYAPARLRLGCASSRDLMRSRPFEIQMLRTAAAEEHKPSLLHKQSRFEGCS